MEEEEDEEMVRKSKDRKVNKEGRRLVDWIRERKWAILNGGIEGDQEGNWAYTGGRGESVIDYVLTDDEVREEVERLEIEGG